MKKILLKILCCLLGAVFTLSVVNMDDRSDTQDGKINLQSPSLVYASMSNRYSNVDIMADDEEDDEETRKAEEADSEKETDNTAAVNRDLNIDDYTINVFANYEEIAARVRGEEDDDEDDDQDGYDGKFVWTKDSVSKVYSSADTSSKVIKQFKKGSKVIRISYSGEWSYVRLSNNVKGYILTKSLSTKKVNLPTPTPKPVRRTVTSSSSKTKTSSKKSTGGGFGSFVRRFVGCKYVAGGASPSGFDCSGFTMYCYRAYYHISLPHGSNMQTSCGRKVSLSSMKVGDLIFIDHDHNGKADHVGIYVGSGQMVHASGVKWGVCCVSVKNVKDILMVRRIR